MNQAALKPQNLPESLVWYYITGTYLLYLLGAQYVCATLLASFLTFYLIGKWWSQNQDTSIDERIFIPISVWVWIIAVLVVEFALIVAHLNLDLGLGQIIKSSFSWYRSWGLLALFPLIGCLNIRPQIVYRAICILCIQSLLIAAICTVAQLVKFPIFSYESPLKSFGGVIDSYSVYLFYVLDENQPRLQLFAPWPPALGLVGNIYFFLARQEANKKLRMLATIGAIAMVFSSVSRLAIVCLPGVVLLTWLLRNIFHPWLHFSLGSASVLLGIFSPTVLQILGDFKDRFNQARSGSSEVRARLNEMAKEAWWNETPIWGHGRMESSGPAVVAFRPIGSHHFWYGTLYSYGLVGATAIGIAFLWSFFDLLIKQKSNEYAQVGLSILLVLFIFTFADNVEALMYLCWPGLLMLGISLKQEPILSIREVQSNKLKKLTF